MCSSENVLEYEMECVADFMLISKMFYFQHKYLDMQECYERQSIPLRDTFIGSF